MVIKEIAMAASKRELVKIGTIVPNNKGQENSSPVSNVP